MAVSAGIRKAGTELTLLAQEAVHGAFACHVTELRFSWLLQQNMATRFYLLIN